MKKKGMGFSARIMMMILVPAVLVTLIIAGVGIYNINNMGVSGIKDELKSFAYGTLERYNALNDDKYTYSNGVFKKGDITISENYTTIDKLKENTDLDTSVFYNSTRVATTLKDENGNRAIGKSGDEKAVETVFKQGKELFEENITLSGTAYCGFYVPIKQQGTNEVIGMLFAGKPRSQVTSAIMETVIVFVIIAAVIILIIVIGGIMLAKRMSGAMSNTYAELDKLSKGVLKFEGAEKALARNDEIGEMSRATKTVIDSLTGIIGEIINTSNHLEEFATKYNDSFRAIDENIANMEVASNEIAKGATTQAMETQNANEGVINLSEAIGEITSNVELLDKSSEVMKDYNKTVDSNIEELVSMSNKTKISVESVYEQTNATNESVNNIRSATELITNIASQTNLLSLNASIEAARAGEMGKGFAVVADQIRDLAEQSKSSAEEIVRTVQTLISNSEMSVQTMGELTKVIDNQNDMLDNTNTVFNSLNDEIGSVVGYVTNITEQVKELDRVRLNVAEVIESLAAISEENAASAEETSASMSELQNIVTECSTDTKKMLEIAEHLSEETGKFTL